MKSIVPGAEIRIDVDGILFEVAWIGNPVLRVKSKNPKTSGAIYELQVGGLIEMHQGSKTSTIDSTSLNESLPIFLLRLRKVNYIRTTSRGEVQVAFEDGIILTIAPQEGYESWILGGPTGFIDAAPLL